MENRVNVTDENINEVINALKQAPRFSDIIVSTNTVEGALEGDVMNVEQYVLSVGPNVPDLKPGMKVIVEIEKLFRRESVSRDFDQERFVLDIFPVDIKTESFEHIGNLISDRLVKLITIK